MSSIQQIRNAERIMAQYERDAGKVVRRRLQFPAERSVSYGNFLYPQVPFYGPRQSRLEAPGLTHSVDFEVEVTKTRWFSGAYTYFLPEDWNLRKEKMSSADVLSNLFNTSLTPEALWDLTPWSWAIDWFANTGDVLRNISAFAGNALILHYGYMMQHTVATTTYFSRDKKPFLGTDQGVGVVKFVVETKQRRRASPYGFGISFESLNATQKAIMTALGLSKGR